MRWIFSRQLSSWIESRFSRVIIRLLTDYLPRYWRRYALTLLLEATGAGCTALAAYVVSHVVNQIYAYRNLWSLFAVCLTLFFLLAAKGFASYGQAVILARIGNAISAENQERLFEKLLSQNLGYFENRHSSEFVAQITYAAGSAANILSLLITTIGRDCLTVLGLSVVMFVQDPLVTLAVIVVMPTTVFFIRNIKKRMREVSVHLYAANTSMLETMIEMVRGLRTIKAFMLEEEIMVRVREQAQVSRRAADELAGLSNKSAPLMEMLGGIAVALLLFYAGYRVIAGQLMFGNVVSFIAAFLLAYDPIKRLTRFNLSLSKSLPNLQIYYQLLDSPLSEQHEPSIPLHVGQGRIEFANVEFSYSAKFPVIRDMTFSAEPCQITALVGPSGGGKSTIISLILGLYNPVSGEIRIDGQNVASVSRVSLRRQITYVGQDVFLFRGTVAENIGVGRHGATREQIIAAAKTANAHDFIMTFPGEYDAPVGEHGVQLSTGQRQRVAIARAFLKNCPLFLLDEPTSALDNESERHVQAALALLCANRTTIIVAHRLQTIKHADRILFIERGAVVETGNHQQLLRYGRRYSEFYHAQFEQKKSLELPSSQIAGSSR
jgi:subfamily B ATP-binding cassette protein MsbA